MKKAFFVLPALLAGCVTVDQVEGPHGAAAYIVRCPGTNLTGCDAKASELCPRGYETLAGGNRAAGEIAPVGNSYRSVPAPREITIQCK